MCGGGGWGVRCRIKRGGMEENRRGYFQNFRDDNRYRDDGTTLADTMAMFYIS